MNIDRLEIPDDPKDEAQVIGAKAAQVAELIGRSLELGPVEKIVCHLEEKTIKVHPRKKGKYGYVAESVTD